MCTAKSWHNLASSMSLSLGPVVAWFSDFLRVGSLRRIDRALLGYSLHCSEAKGQQDAAEELKQMLAAASNPAEAALIQKELAEAQQVRLY